MGVQRSIHLYNNGV
jgi:hypothetical protein